MNNDRRCCIELQGHEPFGVTVRVNGVVSHWSANHGTEYAVVALDHVADTWFELEITCTHGICNVGPAKFNHSWQINTDFCKQFPDLWQQLADHGFDLSNTSDHDLELIQQHGVFVSGGADAFTSWDDLRLNPHINGQLVQLPGLEPLPPHWFYAVSSPDTISFDVTIPPRAP